MNPKLKSIDTANLWEKVADDHEQATSEVPGPGEPPDDPNVIMVLIQGIPVAKAFHDAHWRMVNQALPNLPYGAELKIDDFYDPEWWADQSDSLHWRAGCLLSHWVQLGMLPLMFVGCPRCSKKRYLRA
jgi:hypothetical protein